MTLNISYFMKWEDLKIFYFEPNLSELFAKGIYIKIRQKIVLLNPLKRKPLCF